MWEQFTVQGNTVSWHTATNIDKIKQHKTWNDTNRSKQEEE